jgi:hypothetical protein
MHDTPSTTVFPQWAVDFAVAALLGHAKPPLAPWLQERIAGVAGDTEIKAYVYELGHLPPSVRSCRVNSGKADGTEQVFLAIPKEMISRWWAVLADKRTVGPFAFPASPGSLSLTTLSPAPKQLAASVLGNVEALRARGERAWQELAVAGR